MMSGLNHFLDSLPRTRFGRGGREVPAFRTCGVVGYYLAVIVTLGSGLIRGCSLTVLAAVCVICALSFFVYTYGLSQARWMSIIEVACALRISDGAWAGTPMIYVLFLAILLLALILRRHYDVRARFLSTSHVEELRTLIFATVNQLPGRSNGPLVATTSHGVKVAMSLVGGSNVSAVHISFSMADRPSDLWLLSELAARSVPELDAGSVRFTANQVLHTLAYLPLERSVPPKEVLEETARQIFGAAARYFQGESVRSRERSNETCPPDDARRADVSSPKDAGPESPRQLEADASGESHSNKATVPAIWR